MTYCDPSVLAPYCTATYCERCSKMKYENERKNVPFLANLDTRTRAEREFDEGIGGEHNYEIV